MGDTKKPTIDASHIAAVIMTAAKKNVLLEPPVTAIIAEYGADQEAWGAKQERDKWKEIINKFANVCDETIADQPESEATEILRATAIGLRLLVKKEA